jgi:hypothetical protein
MKKLLTHVAVVVFLAFPTACLGGYMIHLKDGTQFLTDRYFEEGDLIKFERYGGLIGIKKDRIREIQETENSPEEKIIGDQTETTMTNDKTGKQEPPQEKEGQGIQQEDVADKNDVKKDPIIMKRFKALEEKYEFRNNMAVNLLIELKNELTALRDTIISSYAEEEYQEEIRKIADMRFFLTDMILRKSRNK